MISFLEKPVAPKQPNNQLIEKKPKEIWLEDRYIRPIPETEDIDWFISSWLQ